MELFGKTILIIGGSSGMGLEIAKLLSEENNVIITGRDEDQLKIALFELDYGSYEVADEANAGDVFQLYKAIKKKYDGLHLLINNIGWGYRYDLVTGEDRYRKANAEMKANYLSVIRMVDQFLPLLIRVPDAAIVTISFMGGIPPENHISVSTPGQAALHSFSGLLRNALAKDTRIKVFEFLSSDENDGRSANDFNPDPDKLPSAARRLIKGLKADEYEIRMFPDNK